MSDTPMLSITQEEIMTPVVITSEYVVESHLVAEAIHLDNMCTLAGFIAEQADA